MTTKTIVILLQENSSNHGEVNEFDQPQDAERFIEGLLEAGFERRSIRALTAHDIDLLITQKPTVSLLSGKDSTADAPSAEESEKVVPPSGHTNGAHAATEMKASESPAEPVSEDAGSAPYTRNGVRFSSMFVREY